MDIQIRIYKHCWLNIFLILVLATGCKSVEKYQRPSVNAYPLKDASVSDSASGYYPRNEFFTDNFLRSLIDTALDNNWDIRGILERIEISRANYQFTKSALFPSITGIASGSTELLSKNSNNRIGNQNRNTLSDFFIGFQSSWEIDVWHKLRNQRKAAYQRYLSSQEGLQFLKTNIVAEVAKRYYDLTALDTIVTIVQKNILLQQSALEVITIQKEGGRATELAVQQFRAQLLNTQSLKAVYRQRITVLENDLNALLGRFSADVPRHTLSSALFSEMNPAIPSTLLLRRPDIQQAERQLEALETDIEVARAAFLPSITLSPYAGMNAFNPVKLLNPASVSLGIIGGLSAPLINRIAIKSIYSTATAAAREAFYNYQQRITNAYAEVMNHISFINNTKKVLELKKQETETLHSAVDIARQLYLGGYASYLEVIRAQETLLQTELELINTKNQLNQAHVDLYRSLGGGWRR